MPNAVRSASPSRYDAVVSLGANCETAYQLRRLGLRTAAGPFDWFVTYSAARVAEQIEGGFSRFMELADLVYIRDLATTYAVKDAYNLCVSYHDFPLGGGKDGWKAAYPAFRARVDRRTARLRRLMQSGGRLLFVRTGGGREDAERLRSALARTVKGEFELLVLDKEGTPQADERWTLDRVRLATLRKGDNWRGDDGSWDRAMANVRLNR